MSITPALHVQLYTEFRRSGLAPDGTLSGMNLWRDNASALLSQPAEEVDRRTLIAASESGVLPVGRLTPEQQQMYAPYRRDDLDELVRCTAAALRMHPEVGQPAHVDADGLEDLLLRKLSFEDFLVVAQRLKDAGMDLRLVNGAWMWFLLGTIMTWLERRFADPAVPEAERAELLDAFAPALVVVDRMRSAAPQGRQAAAAERARQQEQLAQAQAQAADAQTELAVRHGMPVSRQALLDAARRHADTSEVQAEVAARSAEPRLGRIIE